ncbi:TPA: HEPN domain-containing protein [Photobacterium damselae]
MSFNKKNARKIAGYTFENQMLSIDSWLSRSKSFKAAATLLKQSNIPEVQYTYFYNAAISLELILKAVAIHKGKDVPKNHKLQDLAYNLALPFSTEQFDTLELLSEVITWSGRYPVPKKGSHWDYYYDVVQDKHIIRNGKTTRACSKRFPTLENFNSIWNVCYHEVSKEGTW